MKTRLPIITLLLLVLALNLKAQIAESFSEAKTNGVNMAHLDSAYISGVNIDTNKAAFKGHINEFVKTYRQMIANFAQYLHKNDAFKNKSFHFFNRIYFQSNGTVDYYLYSFKPGTISQDDEALFKKSLNEFIKTYKFPMSAATPFAQCSPVTIEPN